jgi:hypothetical protein
MEAGKHYFWQPEHLKLNEFVEREWDKAFKGTRASKISLEMMEKFVATMEKHPEFQKLTLGVLRRGGIVAKKVLPEWLKNRAVKAGAGRIGARIAAALGLGAGVAVEILSNPVELNAAEIGWTPEIQIQVGRMIRDGCNPNDETADCVKKK